MNNLKNSLEKEGFTGYIIAKEKNILYFTGFLGGARLLIPRDGENILYVHEVNYESAKQTTKNCNVKLVKMGKDVDLMIANQIKNLKLKHVGFDELNTSIYLKLTKVLNNVKLEARKKMVRDLREVKDKTEINYMRKAAEITSEGIKKAFETLRKISGLREYEVAAEIEYTMRKLGSDGVAFDSIVASGVRTAFPHGGCTDRKIRKGDLVIIDVGAKYKNYASDLTRTVIVGNSSRKQIKIFNIVKEAQQKAFQNIQEGIKARAIDTTARDFIKNKGYGNYFVHNLGHGVGLDVHESPTLSPENEEILKAGNVVTVEPGVYITDFGGIRIEDTVLVQKNGAEKLTKSDYKLEIQ